MPNYLPNRKDLLYHSANKVNSLIVFAIICAALIPLSTWAEDNADVSSSEPNALSTLEKCEIYMSSVHERHPDFGSDQYLKCKDMNLFQPLRTITFSKENKQEDNRLSLSKSTNKDWPLVDLSITVTAGEWSFEVPQLMLSGLEYNLSDYILGPSKGYSNIKVGYSGETIIIQLRGLGIDQLTLTPSQCEDESLEYNVTQVLSWYPPFRDDGYTKTFIKWPCTT